MIRSALKRGGYFPHAMALLATLAAGVAPGQILITEVIPGVSTTAANGDTVELYNAGVAAVDLTNWRLTDLDPGAVESNVLAEPTFAPPPSPCRSSGRASTPS